MQIQFCGAAREVTGSCHLITLDDGYKILLDCGLYQGHSQEMADFNETWLFDPAEIDCLVLSHAHIDHTGRVPKLVKDGYKGIVYSTHATRSLCAIMLLDSAYIQMRDAEYYNKRHHDNLRQPLYDSDDVHQTMNQFATFPYSEWFELRKGVEVQFRDAGHILGSASVTLRVTEHGKTTTIGFSGDIGRPHRPILRDPQQMPPLDYLICESTYGDREHENAPAEMEKFLNVIEHTCVNKKGKLLIPAFSIGRTQEIVYLLDQLESEGRLPKIEVFVDSPLAVNATTIFGSHPECYDKDMQEYLLIDDNPFGFNDLHYIRKVEESKRLNTYDKPCIIISASGMMNAGRVKHHLFNSIEDGHNTILIVGYCAPETPGGRLRDGAETLRLFGQEKQVKAEIVMMDSFSAHADRNEIIDFVDNQQSSIRKIFLVHGTLDRQESLKQLMLDHKFAAVDIPRLGETFTV